jgi:hypothetical protein
MADTIFYSWQSDRPNSVNRGFVENALERALRALAAEATEVEEAYRETPAIDKDTQGVPGSPPIVDTIFRKIEGCVAFVPDLTFIGKCDDGRRLIANPNVLIEYGYALNVCGHDRIIPIMNTAYGAPGQHGENLPFDMRHLRHPITYDLSEGASPEEKKEVRGRLIATLTEALRVVLSVPSPAGGAAEEGLFPATPPTTDPSTFMAEDESFTIPGVFGGEDRELSLFSDQRMFLRLIPEHPVEPVGSDVELEKMVGSGHLRPLCRSGAWSPGRNEHGAFVYKESSDSIENMTQLFRTGELWGIDASTIDFDYVVAYGRQGCAFLPSVLIETIYTQTLESYLSFLEKSFQLRGRVKLIAGLVGVKDYKIGTNHGVRGHIHQDTIIYEGTLSLADCCAEDVLSPFFNLIWDKCGLTRPSPKVKEG